MKKNFINFYNSLGKIGRMTIMGTIIGLLLLSALYPVSAANTYENMDPNLVEKFEKSIDWYENQLKDIQGSDRAPILNNLGIGYLALGQSDVAKERFEEAIKSNSSYYYAWINLGVVNGDFGNKIEAIKCYDKAIELVPSDEAANALIRKGNALNFLGKYDEALSAFKKAEPYTEKTDQLALYTGIGLAYYLKKDYNSAEKAFNRAIESDPANATIPYYDLALVKISDKEYDDAKTALEQALDISPSMKSANILLGNLVKLIGNSSSSK